MSTFIAKPFDELTASQIYEILKSRSEIFMLEQNIRCLDMDNVDYKSVHCFLEENGRVVAYLRAFRDDDKNTVRIGRVLSLYHGKGLGTELMERSLDYIRSNMDCQKLSLHSQAYISHFYEKFGFKAVSETFLEEGIEHITMQLDLLV